MSTLGCSASYAAIRGSYPAMNALLVCTHMRRVAGALLTASVVAGASMPAVFSVPEGTVAAGVLLPQAVSTKVSTSIKVNILCFILFLLILKFSDARLILD